MKLSSHAFADNTAIPGEYAFAVPDAAHHYALSSNRNPHLAWVDVPPGTQSFALVCHDPDVPSVGDDVNQEGKRVALNLPRVDFYHWLLLDIPAGAREISAGSHSASITAHGKSGPQIVGGLRHGLNDYSLWFAGDPQMAGDYFGYDGPCPPWNDERLHHYIFTLYALDVAHLEVQGALNGAAVLAALQGHVLAQASLTGTYTLAPDELLSVD
ncbi:YbhB/YbcL family Raf kinase inhibitor-like protein [Pseudomonas tolaasii]|uniref:YbhB/YbcL family Raf kinase inhibitor-like protein n=2 Tax=Pseudomonas tolaasii TaxID=29442 RepID=A0A7Y8ATQ8_PSETO|nr:YbhB/YbcL family Raf kinase inhibitor-like protein [Pseudomonas tolaasii]ARB27980.1 phospholipid-binding protein [Pseudomonas tolaasii]KAB0468746.1 YbhB/YbcL family Raf kinase inhibitor-like protein [Pseudomonas tolaasii]MBY8941778.1 YbhB/YbcL family Raf kinase inhibitor-like protein [Pseudomonas tolaasii]NWC24784.1 YbhB/YbcL family Raf kinase inhibitor-like protein [Pseudomonas tolaasii]NWC41868.1 YbhB/YbcL family Raf kinase inhibitor-like protein [Pseudomonas tolaasii]